MKATGVVRRIDDLGRIVIPKEIRRNFRIRDGESLEIFVDDDYVVLKKYSPMGDFVDFAKLLVDSINVSLKRDMLITDRDKVIACTNKIKSKYLNKTISKKLEDKILNSEKFDNYDEIELLDGEVEKGNFFIRPIVVNGGIIGLVIILAYDSSLTETDKKSATLVSQILGKYIEE